MPVTEREPGYAIYRDLDAYVRKARRMRARAIRSSAVSFWTELQRAVSHWPAGLVGQAA